MNIEILTGATAIEQLQDSSFIARWQDLQAHSDRATPFVSPAFVTSWYRHYGDLWTPLLVAIHDSGGGLSGLVPLARAPDGNRIVGAGAFQAEYPGWLFRDDDPGLFSEVADALFSHWPNACIHLKYLEVDRRFPEWARQRENLVLDTHARPLMRLDHALIERAMRKSANRSKLNRLRRHGEPVIELLRGDALSADDFDALTRMYDFRQGAVNDVCPFLDDSRKRPFLDDWRAAAGDDLQVLLLRVGGDPIAALFGVRRQDRLSNALFAYAPGFGSCSPGKLLLYLGGRRLIEHGFRQLDLTPGGDPWKTRFSTECDEVFELRLWKDAAPARALKRNRALQRGARKAVCAIGLEPSRVKQVVERIRSAHPGKMIAKIPHLLPVRVEHRIYRLHLDTLDERAFPEPALPVPGRDRLEDLIRFRPVHDWQSRRGFLAAALHRLEQGQHVYTFRGDDGRLLHYGWMIPEEHEAFFTEVGAAYRYPEPGAVLYDFFTYPDARGRGLYRHNLRCMLRDLARMADEGGGSRWVYISVLADNAPSRHVIETMGFEHMESIVRIRPYGRLPKKR